MMYKKDEL